jgi:hypothetical protein
VTQKRPTPRTVRERDAYLAGYGAALDHVTVHGIDRVRVWHQMVMDADERRAKKKDQA